MIYESPDGDVFQGELGCEMAAPAFAPETSCEFGTAAPGS